MIDSDPRARVRAGPYNIANYLHRSLIHILVFRTVVGFSSLRCGFRHRQRRQERLVPHCSGFEGTASGRGSGSSYRDLPDMLGN